MSILILGAHDLPQIRTVLTSPPNTTFLLSLPLPFSHEHVHTSTHACTRARTHACSCAHTHTVSRRRISARLRRISSSDTTTASSLAPACRLPRAGWGWGWLLAPPRQEDMGKLAGGGVSRDSSVPRSTVTMTCSPGLPFTDRPLASLLFLPPSSSCHCGA